MTQEAKKFVEFWTFQRGSEKGEDQKFWNSLLSDVLGVADVTTFIQYQVPVHVGGTTKFLDAWIPSTRVLIEHKTRGVDLDALQSGHGGLTPFGQARDYDNNRPLRDKARWIVTCNFDEIRIYDMDADDPEEAFERIPLARLAKEVHRLKFLVHAENAIRVRELEVSVKAGRVVGALYDALLERYAGESQFTATGKADATSCVPPDALAALNKLCVRLVFCVYAEDAGVFAKDQFLDFMRKFHFSSFHLQLAELFKVLRLKPEERGPFLSDELRAFPYVGGALFREDVPIAPFTEKAAKILLGDASERFDWSEISPTIFGAVFESTLNPETRRKDGMHYTSEENIHKVIDPLFLDALRAELAAARAEPNLRKREAALVAFQERLGSLRFLDPACGSGNFLTETYISLRKLENEALALRFKGQGRLDLGDARLVHVSISQFHGIEVNDFAVTVAQTAMWIAECKMMQETNAILAKNFTPLPLADSARIFEGNALRMDWGDLISRGDRENVEKFDYIMGNPPFVGGKFMSVSQKEDMLFIFGKKWKNLGNMDYVSCWYKKAAELMRGTDTRAALVSTNSIVQGQAVASLLGPLMTDGLVIDFAWRTFRWDSEAAEKAHVHCVIIGFHVNGGEVLDRINRIDRIEESVVVGRDVPNAPPRNPVHLVNPVKKTIYAPDGTATAAANINAYLMDGPDIVIDNRTRPICDVPPMDFGNMPNDGGNLLLTPEERDEVLAAEPALASVIRPFIGATEFINGKTRYCFWLKGADPGFLRASPTLRRRVEAVRAFRLASTASATREKADAPHLFFYISHPDAPYLLVPSTSSERRRYVPIGYEGADTIASNAVLIVPGATLCHFGVLTSSVHMAWLRAVGGRMKSDYRYSNKVVYNNFPWPEGTGGTQFIASDDCGRNKLRPSPLSSSNPVNPVSNDSPRSPDLHGKIASTAQAILDVRAKYPTAKFADLYDDAFMPADLRAAHAANDRAVLAAYDLVADTPEPEIVAHLFGLYAQTHGNGNKS